MALESQTKLQTVTSTRSNSLPARASVSATSVKLSDESSIHRTRTSLLVVDDHRDAADALVRLMKLVGREARAVYDGPTCLAEIERQVPDVVLIDIGMPEFDGIELARRIREREQWNSIVLVAVTGAGHEQDQARSQAAGFAAHLVKPVDMALLEQTLDRLLTQGQTP